MPEFPIWIVPLNFSTGSTMCLLMRPVAQRRRNLAIPVPRNIPWLQVDIQRSGSDREHLSFPVDYDESDGRHDDILSARTCIVLASKYQLDYVCSAWTLSLPNTEQSCTGAVRILRLFTELDVQQSPM